MEHPIPPPLREPEARILALCEDHLSHEETLLADRLLSLRQVRDAFFQRNLNILPSLQSHQQQLTRKATEMAGAREQLRETLADLLDIAADKVTLRGAALSLQEPARGRLLQRHARLSELVHEADQLSQQNAALLGYARGFFASLFASLTGTSISERYGPHGERRGGVCGSFLQARV
jgi:hypothetical protein